MIKKILEILRARKRTAQEVEIKSLKEQLGNARFLMKQRENQYLVLVDDHADLRQAYSRLQFARLEDFRLKRIPYSNRL